MAESPFRWADVPAPVLAALADQLHLDGGAAVAALGATFGSPPRTAFVRAAWPVLRDVWLAGRTDVRAGLASGLRAEGIGDTSLTDDAEYLATCPNGHELRSLVLAAFVESAQEHVADVGAVDTADGRDAAQPAGASTSPQATIEIESLEQLDRATEMVLAALDEGDGPVGRNEDGDMLVAHGSALTFVRPAVEPPRLRFASPLLSGVPGTAELLSRLNDMNARVSFGRLYHQDDTVVAEMELICRPFVPEHVAIATNIMSHLADVADDMLQDEFGGKTFFGAQVPPKAAEPYGYGGYL